MTTRARLQNANDSKSLWNYTLSPGWGGFDAHILRLALMRYGCGAWRDINKHFPLKTCGQLNLQTQRLFGQQALAEFQRVHIDPNRIKVINDKIDGFRKNTCLINTGKNVSAQEAQKRRQAHTEKYGIPEELFQAMTVPVVLDAPQDLDGLVDEIEKLREMYRCVYDIELRLNDLKTNGGDAAKTGKAADPKKAAVGGTASKKVPAESTKEHSNSMELDTPAKGRAVAMHPEPAMDDDIAIAMALSASMANANIKTPAIEAKTAKKTTTARKSAAKKKAAKKSAKKSSQKKSAKKSAKKSSAKKLGRKRKAATNDGTDTDLSDEPTKRVRRGGGSK